MSCTCAFRTAFLVVLALVPPAASLAQSDQELAARSREALEEELAQSPDLPESERRALEEHLRFLDGLARALPMPMPDPAGFRGTGDGGVLVTHDPVTGELRRMPTAPNALAGSGRMAPFSGAPPEGILPPDGGDVPDLGGEHRGGCVAPSQDCSTHAYPWRTVTKLLMRFNVNGTDFFYVCSASTVSSFHLLTAGHCIYNRDPDGDGSTADRRFADEIWAWPAQTDLVNPFGPTVTGEPVEADYPYGVAKSVFNETWSAWTDDGDRDWDIGWITLDRRMGDRVGWMGAEWGVESDGLNYSGYPAQTPFVPAGVICPYPENATSLDYSTDQIAMCAFTYGGHSGGPFWRYESASGNRFIHGVLSTSDRMGSSTVTRLTDTKATALYDVRIPTDESVRPPAVRPELIEYVFDDERKDLLQNVVPQGRPFQVEYNVYNVGFAPSGTITVDFYISSNQWITTNDAYVGSVNLVSLNPNGFYNNIQSLIVPCSVAPGSYWVGWIMRCTGTEYTEEGSADANNHVVIADEQLTVLSDVPGSTTLLWPPNGTPCVGSSVTLDWSDVPNATGYEIEVGIGACGLGAPYTSTTSSLTVSGLDPNERYWWRVRATTPCDEGPWTSCWSFITQTTAPGPPALLSPPNGADCQATAIVFDWNDVAAAQGYEFQFQTSCGTGVIYETTESHFAVFGLQPFTTIYWRVRSTNSCGGPGGWSGCFSMTTGPETPGLATLQYPPNGASCIETPVELDWSALPTANLYEVQWGTACGSGTTTPSNTSALWLDPLDPDTEYHWRVRGRNSCGIWGNWTSCATFRTAPVDTELGVATLLYPIQDTCVGPPVTLDWTDVPGASLYRVFYGWDPQDPCYEFGQEFVTLQSEFTITGGIGGGNTFAWRVQAESACGVTGPWTACETFVSDNQAPVNPTLSSTSHETGIWSSDNTVDVEWSGAYDECTEVAGYSILWDTSPTTLPDNSIDTSDSSATSPSLADGQSHYFHLRTRDTAGRISGAVHLGPFWIDGSPPSAVLIHPDGGQMLTCGEVIPITWIASDGLSGLSSVELRYSTDGGATYPNLIANPPLSESSHDWTVPSEVTTNARVKVIVEDVAGNTREDASNGDFSIDCVVGLPSDAQPVTRTALGASRPNPFTLSTTVPFSVLENGPVELVVLDVHGRRVRTLVDRSLDGPRHYEAAWDGRDDGGRALGSGVYFYRLATKSVAMTRRLTLLR